MLWRDVACRGRKPAESWVKLATIHRRGVDSGVNAQRAEFGSPPALELVRRYGFELLERLAEGLAEQLGRLVRIDVGTALGLGHDGIDHAQLDAVDRVRLERGGGFLGLGGVTPQDRRAAFG